MSSALKVAVVTGASSGVGKATAKEFARLGWHVIGVGRNPERSATALKEIERAAAAGAKVDFLRGDFELMADVTKVANDIEALTDRVDVLINNAGNMRDRVAITSEGNEITFASNHLAGFLLTKRLQPLLAKAGSARVLNVSSSGHEAADPIDWDDLQMKNAPQAGRNYCFAKLANVMHAREINRRFDGIVGQSMHPGVIASNFDSHTSQETQAYMATLDHHPPEWPAKTLIWMATAPETGIDGGRYFHDMQEASTSPAALDDEAAARLWDESEKILANQGY
jgi:NAD(P)-dependent dehydrogenase (short-subunit alcohol dehydrogenase family)